MNHKRITGRKKYVFKKYSNIYSLAFKIERRRLLTGMRGLDIMIEHVGSTAVRGLGGKNILDILVGIRSGRRERIKRKIIELHYDFIETSGNARRLFFVRDAKYSGKDIRIHLHLVKFNGYEWRQKTLFRDYLKKHRNAMLEYADVKKRAAILAKGDKEAYMKLKERFINSTMKRAMR